MDTAGIITIAGIVLSIFGAVWSLAWWLSGKFSEIQENVYVRIQQVETTILNKLEYHERHDDTRFSSVRNDIWELRLHNAAQDRASERKEIASG